uniref:Uncharacterized protein n=1 Tax=Anolis carolinensis TaxID=28377 RepID=A0A803TT62_ANOCA
TPSHFWCERTGCLQRRCPGDGNQCYSCCPASTVTIQPPPFVLTIPGPALYCPDQPLTSCPINGEEGSCKAVVTKSSGLRAISGGDTPSLATRRSSLCATKHPLPDLRRPSRPWGEIYGRSVLSRNTINQLSRYSKYHNGFSSTKKPCKLTFTSLFPF